LVIWLVAYRIGTEQLHQPFRRLRIGILASVLMTLLLSLGLVHIGAQRIGGPLLRLAGTLSAFAGGKREQRVTPAGPTEIRAAGRAFNDMAGALTSAEQERDQALQAQYRDQRLTSLGQMAGGIAHEISNPINTILSLTTLIEQDLPDDADQPRSDLRSIREEAERAAETIRSIMNFSRDLGSERARFDAAGWVRDSIALARKECRPCAAAPVIHFDLTEGLIIEGDRVLLQRAVRNLLQNAAQASQAGAEIEIRLSRDGNNALIEVLDCGPGLDTEQLERAFDPFYTTKAEGQGSGLGLSITLGIVQHHGGKLELGNRPGGGAMARILLPLSGAAPDHSITRAPNPL
jgi:two-component system NtrC family sensor kinase